MSDFVQFEDAQGLMGNIHLFGLTPISIDGEIHFATQIRLQHEYDSVQIGSSISLQSSTKVSSSAFGGQMILFSQSLSTDIFDKLHTMNMKSDERLIEVENAIVKTFRELPFYEKCDAAYVELMAEDISISKTISKTITID